MMGQKFRVDYRSPDNVLTPMLFMSLAKQLRRVIWGLDQ